MVAAFRHGSGRAVRAMTGVLLASTTLCGGGALAQDARGTDTQAAAEQTGTGVIIVTSQRRTQDLQDVPISVQVLGEEKLDNLQVDSFEDYVKFLPSVSSQNFGGPFSQLVYMRGVASGGDGNHSGSLPSVGTYLDEQPITTAQGNLNVHLYDIARVEALAGPQGTLYGASSQAGTIRIITNKPDPDAFDFGADAELNHIDHGGFGGSLEGFVNLPIGDRAAARLVGWYTRDAGFIDNVLVSRTYPTSGVTEDNSALVEDDFNDVETFGARLALGIELDDNWTITPQLMAQKQNADGTFAYEPQLGDLNVATFRDDFGEDQWYQAAMTIEGRIGNFDLVYNGSYLAREIEALTDYSDYAYFYDVLYGSGAYFVGDCLAQDYSCPVVSPSQYFASVDQFTKHSQELRVATDIGGRLNLQAGVFYQRQTHDIQQRYKIDDIATFIEVPRWSDTIWLTKQYRVDRDFAVFGEASFNVTDKLVLTGGLRYFKYDNTLIGFFGYSEGFSSRTGVAACHSPDPDGPLTPPSTKNAPCTNLAITYPRVDPASSYDPVLINPDGSVDPRRSKDDGFIHRLNVTYNFTPDVMAYATWSRGFRPGGTNRRGGLAGYKADFLTNYEIGWKMSLAAGTVRWNAALFQLDWDNFQFSILAENGLTEIRNAAQARIRGIESDITLAPAPGLTFTAAATYLENELTQDYCNETEPDGTPITDCPGTTDTTAAPAGTQLPLAPKFKGNVTARYEFDLDRDLMAHVQLAGVYQSKVRTELGVGDNALIGSAPAYGTIDTAFGVRNEASGWRAEAYVTNLLDERGQG